MSFRGKRPEGSTRNLHPSLEPSLRAQLQANITIIENRKSRRTRISSLQRSAEAVSYLQENGYRTLDDFKETCAKAKQQKCQTKKQLDQTNAAITRLNEQLHYTGRYFAHKKTYQQFLNAKNKGKFRSEHNIAISEYESARDWLKSHVMDGTLPSYEYADSQKGKFPGTAKVKELRDAQIEQRNKYRQEYNNAKQKERELSAIQNSVNALINAPTFNEQTKTKRPTDQSL